MEIKYKNNDTNNLVLTVKLPEGKRLADIVDSTFIVKAKVEDSLANAIFNKLGSLGLITTDNEVPSGTRFLVDSTVKFLITDYTNITFDQQYVGALLYKFTGDSDFNENVDFFDFYVTSQMNNQVIINQVVDVNALILYPIVEINSVKMQLLRTDGNGTLEVGNKVEGMLNNQKVIGIYLGGDKDDTDNSSVWDWTAIG